MPTYLAFGRTEFEQPLAQRGTVDAADDGAAVERALAEFGDGWVELTLIPSADVRWILGPDPGSDGGGES